jgi:hypothetical protein
MSWALADDSSSRHSVLLSLPLRLVNRIAPFPDPPENPQLTPIATSSGDKAQTAQAVLNLPHFTYILVGPEDRCSVPYLVSYFFFPFFFF